MHCIAYAVTPWVLPSVGSGPPDSAGPHKRVTDGARRRVFLGILGRNDPQEFEDEVLLSFSEP